MVIFLVSLSRGRELFDPLGERVAYAVHQSSSGSGSRSSAALLLHLGLVSQLGMFVVVVAWCDCFAARVAPCSLRALDRDHRASLHFFVSSRGWRVTDSLGAPQVCPCHPLRCADHVLRPPTSITRHPLVLHVGAPSMFSRSLDSTLGWPVSVCVCGPFASSGVPLASLVDSLHHRSRPYPLRHLSTTSTP
jgi:hypothetical protein